MSKAQERQAWHKAVRKLAEELSEAFSIDLNKARALAEARLADSMP